MEEASEIRRRLALERREGRRYSATSRSLAVGHCRGQQGQSVRSVAEMLGIPATTLWRWLDAERAEGPPAFRQVMVREAATRDEGPGRLILTTPGGVRIEGLTILEAIEVSRVLG
jgi:hypothetical protein